MSIISAVSLSQLFQLVKQPKFIIAYMAIMILIMMLVVVSAMINERRFGNLNLRLKASAEKAEKAPSSRFEMLKSLDEAAPEEKQYVENITLKEFCDDFRNFAAGKLNLYYDISTIREFIAGLAVSNFMILQGMSGTGKTSLAFAFGEFIGNPSAIIPVQPMWKERSDLLGYYNEFTKRFNESTLLQKLYEAGKKKDMFITVLDELNIARVEYYFAEFLSLMEIPDKESRYLEIISDKWDSDPADFKNGRIKLPDNMWFLGTANNDDSTFAISDKVYDRAMIVDLDSRAQTFEAEEFSVTPITAQKFMSLKDDALNNRTVSAETEEKIEKIDSLLEKTFRVSFGNRLMRQVKTYLPVYAECGGDEFDALDDILAKKVLRKLESLNMAYRKNDANELLSLIENLFGKKPERCENYIRKIAKMR